MGYWIYAEDDAISSASGHHAHNGYRYSTDPHMYGMSHGAEAYFYLVVFFLFMLSIVFCILAAMEESEDDRRYRSRYGYVRMKPGMACEPPQSGYGHHPKALVFELGTRGHQYA